MAALFKPTRPYLIPTEAEIVIRENKPHVRIMERGKAIFFPVSKDGKKYLRPSKKWYGQFRDANGKIRRVPLSVDKGASQQMLNELTRKAELGKAGLRDEFAEHRRRPLAELLTEYRQHLLDKGATEKEASQSVRRSEIVFSACGFVFLTDLDATPVERWLADKRRLPKKDGGFGPATSNHYRKALVAFGNWLVKARRSSENPFRHIPKVNEEVDIRHQRRALSADEFARLLHAAETGKVFRSLSGSDRRMLYLVAGFTGLRASELASLTPLLFTSCVVATWRHGRISILRLRRRSG